MMKFNVGALVGGTLLLIAIIIVISCIKIVHQAQALVVERLGAYQATWSVGIHFKIPIIERVARRIDLSGFCTTAGNHKR